MERNKRISEFIKTLPEGINDSIVLNCSNEITAEGNNSGACLNADGNCAGSTNGGACTNYACPDSTNKKDCKNFPDFGIVNNVMGCGT